MYRNDRILSCVLLGAGIIGMLTVGKIARAQSIGVNFSGYSVSDALAPTQSAGVVAQTHWNNVTGPNASAALLNNLGVATGATITTSGASIYDVQTSTGVAPNPVNGNQILNDGGIYSGFTNTPVTVNLSSIPYANYDVYVYTLCDYPANYSVELKPSTGVNATFYGTSPANPAGTGYIDGTTANRFLYKQAMGLSAIASTNNANYVRFTGVSAPNFTMNISLLPGNAASNMAVGAVQIVQTVAAPEPDSLFMLAWVSILFVGSKLTVRCRRKP